MSASEVTPRAGVGRSDGGEHRPADVEIAASRSTTWQTTAPGATRGVPAPRSGTEHTENRSTTMRVMVIVKADADSEAGVLPDEELLTAMGRFNEELVNAGIMLAGEGLKPSSEGVRVTFAGEKRSVTDGPFAETKELIAGYWLWQVKSMEEAIEWVKRCPNPMQGESVIEIRPVFEADEFGEAFTPELREQEERLRARVAAPQAKT
jgi:hypothetical protein